MPDYHSSPTVDELVARSVPVVRSATGMSVAFGGVVRNGRQVRVDAFSGPTVGALRGLVLNFGSGLGGKVVALRRPLAVNDYITTDRISHQYDRIIAAEGLRAMVAAPVVVGRTVHAVLWAAVHQVVPVGDRTIQAVIDIARELEQKIAVSEALSRTLIAVNHVSEQVELQASTPRKEKIREVYAELRALSHKITDESLRSQLNAISDQLATTLATTSVEAQHPALSPRETDVLSYVALGCTNVQIGEQLGLRLETVKSYLRSSMRKLECDSRLAAVVAARRRGLLP